MKIEFIFSFAILHSLFTGKFLELGGYSILIIVFDLTEEGYFFQFGVAIFQDCDISLRGNT